jgi:Ca-activated chloride channel homolog
MKQFIFIISFTAFSVMAFGQNERKHVRSGNKLYMEAAKDTSKIDTVKFANAETEYRKALNKKPNDLKWNFNLADAIYKQNRFDEAAGKFGELADKMETPVEKARVYHNMGNSQLMNSKVDESIDSYKKALRQNPSDLETKYNLAYAQLLKKKQEQQKKDQDKNKDKNQDKKDQDKDKQDQNKDQQNKDKQNQNKDQQNKDNQQQKQQQQNKISKENAEQLLQVLQNDERKIQDKVKKEQAVLAKRTKTEKEW